MDNNTHENQPMYSEQSGLPAHPQPQPLPQPAQAPSPQVAYLPSLEGVDVYFAAARTPTGPQMYTLDTTLKQWRLPQQKELEHLLISLGIPAQAIAALRSMPL